MGYGFIKSIKVQPLKGTTAYHRDENVVHIEGNKASFNHKWVSTILSTILSQSMGLDPIPFEILRTTRLVNPLVSGSVRFFSDLMYLKEMMLCFRNCFTA